MNKHFPQAKGCVAVGTGLVALDVVLNGRSSSPIGVWAGGTCGNVLAILSFLGWQSYPIARLRDDLFAEMLVSDLQNWKVKTKFIERSKTGSTPIIVQRIKKNKDGVPHHTFGWNCPNCGARLPVYKAVKSETAQSVAQTLPEANVFFFDRVNRGAIEMARACREDGAIVCFEPTSTKDESLFAECLQVADIVKYSHEHSFRLPKISVASSVFLEIETFGDGGLRFRHLYKNKRTRWERAYGYQFEEVVDTAGAGDWLTAGLLHSLSQNGRGALRRSGTERILQALELAQALAGLNCQFEGARGMMYSLTRHEVDVALADLIDEELILDSSEYLETEFESDESKCPACFI